MKFDMHTNLGSFPGSETGGKVHNCTVGQLAEHINKHELTHAVVLYPYDGIKMLEELSTEVDAKLYGMQCAFFNHKPEFGHYPELGELELHTDHPLWAGMKWHSHRGYYNINGEIQNGIDYGKGRLLNKVLKRLPKGSVNHLHTQGTASPYNTSSPMSIANLAAKNPYLKFILSHAGDYGPRAFTAKPSAIVGKDDKCSTLLGHLKHRMAVASSVEVANTMHNVFLNASNFTVDKARILKGTKRWCVGTDIPFADAQYYDFGKEESDFFKFTGEQETLNGYRHALNFMERDMDYLLKVQKRYYNFSYVHANDKPVKVKK